MNALLVLAQEGVSGVPPEHLSSKLAVPIGILLFCGSVYLLLWSIYGAKKALFIYSTCFWAFWLVLGVFWWFGAPGTPQATGLASFPWQRTAEGTSDVAKYTARWYPFEAGSDRASHFPVVEEGLEGFRTPAEYLGLQGATDEALQDDPGYRFVAGDLDTSTRLMIEQFMPTDESGSLRIGGRRRQAWNEAAGEARDGEVRDDPFFTARVKDFDGDEKGDYFMVKADNGLEVAAAELEAVATYVIFSEAGRVDREIVVESRPWYAFKDPGAVWFPSAVFTIAMALLFGASLFGLDRIEQREKKRAAAATTTREPVTAGSKVTADR